jgi:hypothetical protein
MALPTGHELRRAIAAVRLPCIDSAPSLHLGSFRSIGPACWIVSSSGRRRTIKSTHAVRTTRPYGWRLMLNESAATRLNGRPVGTRTPDLYRVNSEVQKLNPFACFAFPFIASRKLA